MSKIPNFYRGGAWYCLAYTGFITMEFAIHDQLMEFIEMLCLSEDETLLQYLFQSSSQYSIDELSAGFLAGYCAAFFTNGLETIAVNKQTNPKLSVRDILFSNQDALDKPHVKINKFMSIVFQGWRVRCFYYGI